MVAIAPTISKEAVPDTEAKDFKEQQKNVFNASYNNVEIEVYQCNMHSNEFVIMAKALGVTLHVRYWVNAMSIGIEEILQEAYNDFCSFVVAVGQEEHETKH